MGGKKTLLYSDFNFLVPVARLITFSVPSTGRRGRVETARDEEDDDL
jgi:hypothetical protein